MVSYPLGIEIGVTMAYRKTCFGKKSIHFGISSPRSVPKDIQTFIKAVNKVGVTLNISKRLFHVNLFLQILMQEGVFYIHLMDLPFM